MPMAGRRAILAGLGVSLAAGGARAAASLPELRLGILQFGTVQWVSDVIRRHDLDTKHGFALGTVKLANTEGGRIALMAASLDVVVSDWLFVAVQRAAGTRLCFAPFSNASGGIMTASGSPIRTLRTCAAAGSASPAVRPTSPGSLCKPRAVPRKALISRRPPT